jgi:hypothetical protein
VIADLSVNHVERHVLLAGHTLHRVYFDYGYDLAMFTYSEHGEAEPGFAFFQVKATDQLRVSQSAKSFGWRISRRDLRLWLNETYPVMLIVYDAQRNQAYWLDMQQYFAGWTTADLFTAGETIRVHVPLQSRLNQRSIGRIAEHKRAVHKKLLRKEHPDD